MSEIIEISRQKPENKSMDYDFLRQEGIKYIQELSSNIWTDYNSHDPGITILEALCYAITDIGFRAAFPIKDIIATEGANYNKEDRIKNFYTAEQILPNAPLTINDYRKLLMDIQIEVELPGSSETEFVGVKNAWLRKADTAEQEFYFHSGEGVLSYKPKVESDSPITAGSLYNVLLEFSDSGYYDDLNHNTIDGYLTIYDYPSDKNLVGLNVSIDLVLPRWDAEGIDWDDLNDIKANIQSIDIGFENLPDNYSLIAVADKDDNFNITLSGSIDAIGSDEPQENKNLELLLKMINDFLLDPTNKESLIYAYQQKIQIIQELVDEVNKSLSANRNLCDDFNRPTALKVEEIGICADLQVEPDANIEELQAKVYFEIGKFLSPTVNFYTLKEMVDLCKTEESWSVTQISTEDKTFTVNKNLSEKLVKGDTVSIKNSISNAGQYTISSVSSNAINADYSNIKVEEDIPSGVLSEGEIVSHIVTDEDSCLTIDEIFEGPLLKHGFIHDEELVQAELMEVIHVSDLIQIIMDIPGVIAVKNLEIASYPEDPSYDTELQSVKWVLNLLFKENYVPRLSIDKSTCVFYKGQLPYKAVNKEVEDIIDELKAKLRPQKITTTIQYPEVPKGTYRNIESFSSIQDEFPLSYGVGYEGIPDLSNLSKEDQQKRIASTRQLKAYLMFFDQLLANYLSQLAHVKELFSMNAERDESGEYKIGRTYYLQPLFDIVHNSDPLYINKEGHVAEHELITENEALFNTRRNKFLDHLLARFAENFTDYAMLITRLSDNKAPRELIDDKLNFLNQYPEISSNRGLAFNYKYPSKLWHIDNQSGLEKRSALFMGISPKKAENLVFNSQFKIELIGSEYVVSVISGGSAVLKASNNFTLEYEAKELMELWLVNGAQKEHYQIVSEVSSQYYFNLLCDKEIIATSVISNYATLEAVELAIDGLITLFEKELLENHEANRNNLTPPLYNYFKSDSKLVRADEKYYKASVDLYENSLSYSGTKLLSGGFELPKAEVESALDVDGEIDDFIWKIVVNGVVEEFYTFEIVDGNYVFHITNRDGQVLATSVENNFNNVLANRVDSLKRGLVKVSNSTTNNGYHLIKNAEDDGPNVVVNLKSGSTIPSATTDGNLSITESYAYALGGADNMLVVDQDISSELAETSVLALIDGSLETDYLSVSSFEFNAGKTSIVVNETLVSNPALTALIIINTHAYSLDEANRTFSIDEDLTDEYAEGDILSMWKNNKKRSEFTIKSINRFGDKTQIVVKESLSNDPRGRISFTKIYQQIRIDSSLAPSSTNAFTIRGGEDKKAVQRMIKFIREKFMDKEGVHVLEHVILRPKNNGPVNYLYGNLSSYGMLQFKKTLPVASFDSVAKSISIIGDIADEIYINPETEKVDIVFTETEIALNPAALTFNAEENTTQIELGDNYPIGVSEAELTFTAAFNIIGINEESQTVLVDNINQITLNAGDSFSIINSTEAINDNTYSIENIDAEGITISSEIIQDKLMPVFVSESNGKKSTQLKNPYTSIATVVLPYWPERFNNMDFRNFFEKTLRTEAPSHVLLKICWINPMHMEAFEHDYKQWLLEVNSIEASEEDISAALSELIDSVDAMRNVYPVGTLYDPTEHQTLKNTIILNNTMIGNF